MKLSIVKWSMLVIAIALSWHSLANTGEHQRIMDGEHNQQEKQRILVLNSYSHGYKWTDNIVRAIRDEFKDNPNVIIHIEYMDTKMVGNQDHLQQLSQLYQSKYADHTIDVIISSDDDALEFLREYRDQLFPGTPVVFCGVNNFSEKKVANFHSYTGVSEESDFTSNFELILKLHPNVKKLYVINDNLATARGLQTEFFESVKEYEDKFEFEILSDYSLKNLINKISSLEEGSIVYYLSFFVDNTGRPLTPGEVIPYISKASPVPVYGSVDYMIGHGIIGGMLGSGHFQGKTAANAAQKILDGYSVDKIPVVFHNSNSYMFDYHHLQRFGIKLSDLPESAVVHNKPQNLFEQYTHFVIVAAVFFGLLIVYIFMLISTAKKRTRTRQGLQKITEISSDSLDITSIEAFERTLLVQLDRILPFKSSIALKVATNSATFDQYDIVYVQGSGKYETTTIEEGRYFLPERPLKMIGNSFDQQTNTIKKNTFVIFLKSGLAPITLLYIEAKRSLDIIDSDLLELFNEKISMVLECIEKNKMEVSLDTARDIQMGMLPTNFVEFNYKNPVDLRAFISTSKELGGDLYDFFVKDKDKIVFTIGDVSGSGVPAALFTTVVKTLVHSISEQYDKPSDILYKVNNELYHHKGRSMFATLFLAILDLKKSELHYANADHQPPYFVDPKGSVQSIAVSQGVALGRFENVEFTDEQTIFEKNDGILLYSDGVTGAMDLDGNEYGNQRLKSSLAKVSTKDADKIIKFLIEDIRSFTSNASQVDDMTLLFLRNRE